MTLAGRDIQLAIFDLDGTLVSSTDMWEDIDHDFFQKRGMKVPFGYGQRVAHMGLQAAAAWTQRTYLPNEKVEDILREWHDAALDSYANYVDMKLHAKDVLDLLIAHDLHIALATVNAKELYLPCLKRLQILDYFEEIVDADDVGIGKSSSKIYDEITARFGLSKENVVVFEDALSAMTTAHDAGYLTVGVYDAYTTKHQEVCEDNCDLFIKDWYSFGGSLEEKKPLPILSDGQLKYRRFFRGYEVVGPEEGYKEGELIIPTTFNGLPVYKIADHAFQENAYSSITLPEGLRDIGFLAFDSTKVAKEIVIPKSVSTIDYSAFSSSSFVTVEFKGNVETMTSAFGGLEKMKKLIFPEGFKRLPFRGFWFSLALEEVDLPEGLLCIGSQAFNKCDILRKVTLPHSLETIRSNAFFRCPKLAEVYYHGTQEDWDKIDLDSIGNETLINAKFFFI